MIFVLGLIRGASAVDIAYGDFVCPHRPLIMYAGEEREVGIRLQNPLDTDQKVRIIISGDGGGVFNFDEGDYMIKAKTFDKEVKFKVKIPETAELGAKYDMGLKVQDVPMENQGGIALTSGMGIPICVQVGEYVSPALSPETDESNLVGIAVGVIALIIIILVIYFAMRKKK